MADTNRTWRRPESYEAERITRGEVGACLTRHGFADVKALSKQSGSAIIQTVRAQNPWGEPMIMRVKLCWRLERGDGRARNYSAFQLSSNLVDDDWEKTVARLAESYQSVGNTHVLAVQYGQDRIEMAAAIPCDKLAMLWRRQDEIGRELIDRGEAGRLTKSPARNGRSPTLYLMDDRTPHTHRIAEEFWSCDGVINIKALDIVGDRSAPADDSLDDCPDALEIGRDEGSRTERMRSGFSRTEKVRRAVRQRAGGQCERQSCGQRRDFDAFLDVHHLFGVSRSDRPSTRVALCPNCHREAHHGPAAAEINASLIAYAAGASRP